MAAVVDADYVTVPIEEPEADADVPRERMDAHMAELEEKMREAARRFDFKQAAAFRDRLQELKNRSVLNAAT
jgi:excinuclease ABC subunit B